MKRIPHYFVLFFLMLGGWHSVSCKKERLLTDKSARLLFSVDTVLFDTVFTTIGSVTKQLKVYNPEKKTAILSGIQLAKGNSSNFRINVDGLPGPSHKDIEILPEDSIYIFVEVTVDPQNSNNPMVIQDSILFYLNGNLQDVDLVAWGQDVNYINSLAICTETWTKTKPYLIYNVVLVDSQCVLTIEPGTQVHFHGGAVMVVDGTLKVNGTKDEPVIFQGDRLEQFYEEKDGQWFGIWIRGYVGSINNEINYAEIKNATIGLQVDSVFNSSPTLRINNSTIKNMSAAGIFSQGGHVEGYNNVVANCGQYAAALTLGGAYDFIHCTFANYWSGTRKSPAVVLNNYFEDVNDQVQPRELLKANFTNCIIYGNIQGENGETGSEVALDENPGTTFNYFFKNTLIKTNLALNGSTIYTNTDPGFKNTAERDFELVPGSFAIDKGDPSTLGIVPSDIKGRPRNNPPDLGAYEFGP